MKYIYYIQTNKYILLYRNKYIYFFFCSINFTVVRWEDGQV